MTENEVMGVLKNEKECVLRNIKGCDRDCGKCDLVMDDSVIVNAYDRAIMELQENHQYRAIGTVEECREARERHKPKIPNIWGDGYDNDGNMIYDIYDCPNCGKSYEIDYHDYKYCPECGQAIDRSDLDRLV